MNEETYKKLKKKYEEMEGEPSGRWLCKTPGDGKVYFGIKPKLFLFGVYDENQNGFIGAVEKTALPKDPVCDKCGQEIRSSDDK